MSKLNLDETVSLLGAESTTPVDTPSIVKNCLLNTTPFPPITEFGESIEIPTKTVTTLLEEILTQLTDINNKLPN